MCGLIFAWAAHGLHQAPLAKALGRIRHRGPDAAGSIWRDGDRVYLGHTRLKVIDSSDGANQPFLSPCGRWALVFNGEIFNYREIKEEIGDQWCWRTSSDTEVLLASWTIWGHESLNRLVGMFSFAIHDEKLRTITVVRDRFGVKPLYYLENSSCLVFASEIPPLLCFLDEIVPDRAAIRTYLEFGHYDHSEHTFFEGVYALAPGSLMHIDLQSQVKEYVKWYRLSENIPDLEGATVSEVMEQTSSLLYQAISSHLVADVSLGLNVSGGVDSSMLADVALERLGHAHLFTQDYAGYSELPWVRQVAKSGTLHVAQLDFLKVDGYLAQTVRSQAQPFGGVFVCGYNAVYEAACANGVVVLLDGNGVDETFLGYKRYHQIHVCSAGSEKERNRRANEFKEFWGHAPSLAIQGASIDGTLGLCPGVISPKLQEAPLLNIPSMTAFRDPVRSAAAEDLLYTKIPRGLRFNDHVSMAHSRELRVPYLDHRLVEFAFGIPVSMLISGRGGKLLFRDILAQRVPPRIAYAKKRSVQSPQREWLAVGWRAIVESVLGSNRFADRGWVDPDLAKLAYQAYLSGEQANSFFIWQWLNLELWAREFIDGEGLQ